MKSREHCQDFETKIGGFYLFFNPKLRRINKTTLRIHLPRSPTRRSPVRARPADPWARGSWGPPTIRPRTSTPPRDTASAGIRGPVPPCTRGSAPAAA